MMNDHQHIRRGGLGDRETFSAVDEARALTNFDYRATPRPPEDPPAKPTNRDAIAKRHEKTKRARRARVAASKARRGKR